MKISITSIFKEIKKRRKDRYSFEDPWGLDLRVAEKSLKMIFPIYKKYFKVRVFGQENLKNSPYMIIANHSGQIAIDGVLISTSFVVDVKPPRIIRPLIERFVNTIPFFGQWGAQNGAVLGDRDNCINLLSRGESVLAFPEGVRGITKSTPDYYKLQNFTKGFFRLAITAGVPILPMAVVGAEEFFPWVYQAKDLAKKLKIPAFPIMPLYFPMPSPVDIYIGTPYEIPDTISADSTDQEIEKYVLELQDIIQSMLKTGLKKRRSFWGNIKGFGK